MADLLPLYCEDCNEVHMMRWLDIERIVYALQGEVLTLVNEPDIATSFDPDTADCLLRVLDGSHDGEVFKEHVDSRVGCREHHQPLDCPKHDDEPGLHHVPLCHYFDDDPALQPLAALDGGSDG